MKERRARHAQHFKAKKEKAARSAVDAKVEAKPSPSLAALAIKQNGAGNKLAEQDGYVVGIVKLDLSNLENVISNKEKAENALSEAIAPQDVPTEAVRCMVSLGGDAGSSSSFMTLFRNKRRLHTAS